MAKTSKGILLQGKISDWTLDIIKEYQKNFPETEILLSTWNSENVDEIPCDIIQLEPPAVTKPFAITINHQIVGSLAGLKKMSADIIMKCRTDQFIHNNKVFRIFEDNCPPHKIMIPNYATIKNIDYFASDFCQIATKDILMEYWNSIEFYDGSFPLTHAEIYLTINYVLNAKKDLRDWPICLKEYFYVKGFSEDFQIEWEKLEKIKEPYQRWYEEYYPICIKPDQ